jgi:hypothetical protein
MSKVTIDCFTRESFPNSIHTVEWFAANKTIQKLQNGRRFMWEWLLNFFDKAVINKKQPAFHSWLFLQKLVSSKT